MNYLDHYREWLASDMLSEDEKQELREIADNDDEIRQRFSSYLSFGTAGLRGVMKVGMNAMNVHTVAYATQGLAALILKENRAADGVVIAYDCRNNSSLFARTAASVLAANGIKVYIFDELRPTPELSFALRELKCVAGINITASHNPKQYNGYKAYWEDGAQLPPEHAETVSAEIAKLNIFTAIRMTDYRSAVLAGKINVIGSEIDEKYLAAVKEQTVNPGAIPAVADDLKIVYSPLHGTGYRLVPEILKRAGLKHLYTVDEQMQIDGNFPTVAKPNPEYPEVFKLGIEIANRVGSDLIIATDPDADRVGVMTRAAGGGFITITGNQMGALLLDYIITAEEQAGTLPKDAYAVKTIVSTELASKICREHGVTMYNVLTGFKFIGEVIKNYEAKGYGHFLLGFEESYGYLKGTYARDKDAVVASMLIAEMTAYYKAKNMTLSDALNHLYERYGYCFEANEEVYMEGVDGPRQMAEFMDRMRNDPPKAFGCASVAMIGDYEKETMTTLATGKAEPTGLPKSNVLYYRLENNDVIVIRPSGTEPKIKFYYLLLAKDKTDATQKYYGYRDSMAKLKKW